MHNSNDEYKTGFDGVQDRVRENVRQTTTNIFIYDAEAVRVIENSSNCGFNFIDKPQSEERFAFVVPMCSFSIFVQRLWMELIPHRKRESRTD